MMRSKQVFLSCVSLLCLVHQASAHYLWVTIGVRPGEFGAANIYFEESPSAGDGHYLDHFTDTSKTSLRTVEKLNPQPLNTDVRDGEKRWLQASLPAAAPRSIDCYGKFGVYRYGETNVLLHYYARYLDVTAHEDLHELGRAEQMELDIVPHDHQQQLELTVLWRGKPSADRTVHIRGPKQFKKNIKTDEHGSVRFHPDTAGRYTFRTSVEEEKSGRDGNEQYSLIRHNGTLIMELPLQK